jgi:hypothetical protein
VKKNTTTWTTVWQGLFALLIVAVVIVIVFLFIASIAWLVSSLFALPKELVATIIAAMLTVGSSVGSLIWSRRDDRRKDREQKIREQNTPLYEEFMKLSVHSTMNPPPGKEKPSKEEMLTFFWDWIPDMFVWGSAQALKAVAHWKFGINPLAASTTPKKPLPTTLKHTVQLFRALRADLGHDDRTLSDKELLSLVINDTDDYEFQ